MVFVVHRLVQSPGPDSTAAAVTFDGSTSVCIPSVRSPPFHKTLVLLRQHTRQRVARRSAGCIAPLGPPTPHRLKCCCYWLWAGALLAIRRLIIIGRQDASRDRGGLTSRCLDWRMLFQLATAVSSRPTWNTDDDDSDVSR